jgi:SAM-dependent MidA family methyltransferase
MTKISFAEFQERALYGPLGYFSHNDVVGKRGDFVTSPSLGEVFGKVVGNALDAWWEELGKPSVFAVYECGGADGTLAKVVLGSDLECSAALQYSVIERSATARERLQLAGIPHRRSLPEAPVDAGVVFANEMLDNMPVSVFEFDGDVWREVCFDETRRSETFRDVLPHTTNRLAALVPNPRPGARAPLQTEARGWLEDAMSTLERGRVVCIDYARTTAEMARLEQHDWLRTYRSQAPGSHPFVDPGSQDITCDVALDQLTGAVTSSQADFLERYGIEDIRQAAMSAWEAGAAEGTLDAMRARGVLSEIDALMSPEGLGGFTVFEWLVP